MLIHAYAVMHRVSNMYIIYRRLTKTFAVGWELGLGTRVNCQTIHPPNKDIKSAILPSLGTKK